MKHPFPDMLDILYGSGGLPGSGDRLGDEDSKTNEDDSLLEGPINVESTVSSDK